MSIPGHRHGRAGTMWVPFVDSGRPTAPSHQPVHQHLCSPGPRREDAPPVRPEHVGRQTAGPRLLVVTSTGNIVIGDRGCLLWPRAVRPSQGQHASLASRRERGGDKQERGEWERLPLALAATQMAVLAYPEAPEWLGELVSKASQVRGYLYVEKGS